MDRHFCSAAQLPTWKDEKAIHECVFPQANYDIRDKFLDAQSLSNNRAYLRRILASDAMPAALFLPWFVGMLLSCFPFVKLSLSEAPYFLLMVGFTSTLEVLGIVAIGIYPNVCQGKLDAGSKDEGSLREKLLRAWFCFLFIGPLTTDAMVIFIPTNISCAPDDELNMKQPVYQVGLTFIKAIALCRSYLIRNPVPSLTSPGFAFLFAISLCLVR
ncbi:hypothetical protein FOFC_16109 [Fusarium oxysporum]|nr:hypothetical protein FOFC_16109 [Fusarium oxysporum]